MSDEEIEQETPEEAVADERAQTSAIGQREEEYVAHVFEQLSRKKWDELEVLEHDGQLYFPEKLYRRKKDGTFEGLDVMLKPLRGHEKRAARVEARKLAAKEGIDPEKDADIFDDLDTLCLLWRAVRSPKPPYEPFALDVDELEKRYDRESLKQLWSVLDSYNDLVNPAAEKLGREHFLAVVAAIAEGRSIRPLRAFGGRAQSDCIVTMATLLHNSLTSKSSSESSESSTPG